MLVHYTRLQLALTFPSPGAGVWHIAGGLGGEKARWTETAESLAQEFTNLTGDMLISAGLVAYAGAFTPTYRNSIVRAFLEMCKWVHGGRGAAWCCCVPPRRRAVLWLV